MIIRVVGIGPAGTQWLTAEAKKAIQWANVIIGTERQLESVNELIDSSQKTYAYESVHKDMTDFIDAQMEKDLPAEAHPKGKFRKWHIGIVVLASGDPSLYGVGKYLIKRYNREIVTICPSISSIQYLFAVAGQDMNDVYLTSCHGREVNFDRVFNMPKTGLLTDDKLGPFEIAAEAKRRGLNPRMIIGERLGYPDEHVEIAYASEVPDRSYGLNVVIVINEEV